VTPDDQREATIWIALGLVALVVCIVAFQFSPC
jgi:uncharacterized membrane protein